MYIDRIKEITGNLLPIKFIEDSRARITGSQVIVRINPCKFKTELFMKQLTDFVKESKVQGTHSVMFALEEILCSTGIYISAPGLREQFSEAIVRGANVGDTGPLISTIEKLSREFLYKSMKGNIERVFNLDDVSDLIRYRSLVSNNSSAIWIVEDCTVVYRTDYKSRLCEIAGDLTQGQAESALAFIERKTA